MSNNNPWYPDNRYRHDHGHQRQPPPPQNTQNPQYSLPNPVQNGQRLLAAYPPASATPMNHAVRHIPPMTLGNTPTFHSHNYYPHPDPGYSNSNRGPYGDYDQRLQYIANPQVQSNDSQFWQNTRNDATRMVGGHSQPPMYAQPMRWTMPEPVSSYQTPPFAQSVLQRAAPATAYPTPPPPSMNASSSSLAGALGASHQPPQLPPPKAYHPNESPAFFNDYLDRKIRQIHPLPPKPALVPVSAPPPQHTRPPRIEDAVIITPQHPSLPSPTKPAPPPAQLPTFKRNVTPPPKSSPLPPASSPDPLLLPSGVSQPSIRSVTPLKRKPVVELSSPSVKRLNSSKPLMSSSGSFASIGTAPPSSQSSTESKSPSTANDTPNARAAAITPSSTATSFSRYSVQETPTHKRVMKMAYVAVPPSPHTTPRRNSQSVGLETPDDLGGYGSESSPTKPRSVLDSAKSSARRTGDRDERGPLEKLLSLMEDIFEAEDTIPADVEINELSGDYFSFLSTDPSRPMLASSIVRKLGKYIAQIARPTKRHRQTTTGVMGTPRGKGRMADLDPNQLSRLLKILERSVKAGEDVDAFPQRFAAVSNKTNASPRKPSGKKTPKAKKIEGRSKSQSPNGEDEPQETDVREEVSTSAQVREIDFQHLTRSLEVARESILAADCCIALLASDRLPKQLYSEELITSCFSTVKSQLTKILYPFVEASAESGLASSIHPLLQTIVKNTSAHAPGHRQQLGNLFQALSAVIPRINDLVNAESVAMSDSIIIQTVYIAIGPFFVIDAGGDESGKGKKENAVIKTLGKSAMRGLRLDALSLIRSVFANHEDQRSWIIEEILSSLIKLSDSKQKAGQFKLRDGRSIRTVSALLMQLVQTSAHDVRIQARKIQKTRQNKFALKRQESMSDSQPPAPEPLLDETDHEEIRLYASALESATKAAKAIIAFLTQKSGKGKATKNSNEAEYRTIFDHLIEDLLVVLFWPEWPAAALILSIASKFMVASLDDVKTNSAIDTAAAKAMALDHLGVIAARLRTSTLKIQKEAQRSSVKALKPLDEVLKMMSLKSLNRLLDAHQDVTAHLCKRASEDQAYDSARELTAATLGQEFAAALQRVNQRLEDPDKDDDLGIDDESKLRPFGQRLKSALRDVWKDQDDVFDVGSQEEVARIDSLAEEIGTIQVLRHSFNPILSTILVSLDAQAVNMRTKAIRALGSIVTSDPSILSLPNVRRGIESHLLDSSPAVRDAAVELIGKYIIETPEVAKDYYPKIADRIADTGLGVRKRVIKLLKSVYLVMDDQSQRIDIATRFVLRMLDEDDTVKDLAIKTIEEIWFPSTPPPSALKGKSAVTANGPQDKTALVSKVGVIMGTAANFKDRQSPLEDVLHKIMAGKEGAEAAAMHARYGEICEALIDSLVDASDLPGFTVINCIRTIYLLTSAYPSILSATHASTLLPYLKNASSAEELATSDYLLKIFRVTIPHMPKTASKFGQELQSSLQPMILKPSIGHGGGMMQLQETVGCMCVVVQNLTHDYARLVNLVKSCNARLQQTVKRPATTEMPTNEATALIILIFIISLLVENCNFDNVRRDHPNLANDLNLISQGSITEHIYNTLLTLYEKHSKPSLRGRILQCLGFLFRAQPTLMTMDRSASIMDAIFASPDEEERGRLLKIIQEFLVSEAEKHSVEQKESAKTQPNSGDVNMDELIGNTDGFADSGVSSAIVQRYLDQVLDAALSLNPLIQAVAIDVLSFTIKQGLAHPLQSFPVIIALETSPVNSISNRATALHAILQGKHASMLNTRYTISARASYEYQKKLPKDVHGFRLNPHPIALLQRWYAHAREKRQTRLDYLKSLVKVFQENESYEASVDDVDYTRYMAENFASFDYKTLEEVFTVIRFLTRILSTTGMHLLEMISPSHLLNQLRDSSSTTANVSQPAAPGSADPESMDTSETTTAPQPSKANTELKIPVMRTSVIIAIVMLLKAHLKTLYGLSEEKCLKFPVGKKSALGDKPPVRRHENPISWARLPFATTPLLTNEDAHAQRATFLAIWNEDGASAEPEDEEYM